MSSSYGQHVIFFCELQQNACSVKCNRKFRCRYWSESCGIQWNWSGKHSLFIHSLTIGLNILGMLCTSNTPNLHDLSGVLWMHFTNSSSTILEIGYYDTIFLIRFSATKSSLWTVVRFRPNSHHDSGSCIRLCINLFNCGTDFNVGKSRLLSLYMYVNIMS